MNALDMLAPDGPIAERMDRYESRPQQIEMASAVRDAFDRDEHLIVEAGTGVGKTFAYLLPAIERALDHDERVIVSTRTIALQEQLVLKDVPFLKNALPVSFKAELIKGRSNYLGLRRLAVASKRQDQLFPRGALRDELYRVEDWALQTVDGSLSDMDWRPAPAVWERARSEADNCMGRKCAYYEKCFYQRARRRAESAQIVIVNHALFFADLALRSREDGGQGVLPPYDRIILDEAHTVEDVARDHFGLTVSDTQVGHLLNSLYHERTKRGVLRGANASATLHAVRDTRTAAQQFFTALLDWHRAHGKRNGRLTDRVPIENTLSPALRKLIGALNATKNKLPLLDDRFELNSQKDRAAELADRLDALLSQDRQGWVYWLETPTGPLRRVTLCAKPIDVSEILNERLFGQIKGIILTSATLTTARNDGFNFLRKRIGLTHADELKLGSPFDFQNQMTVHVESNMPDPADTASFIPAACDAIQRHVVRSGGCALVLFTSYDMLNDCAARVQAFFNDHRIPLMVQGRDLPRSTMIDRMRNHLGSVIFGTESFWEGIDVPGQALTNVIIVKLPFAVPSRPEVEARIEHIQHQGGVPFREFQLPDAILKFKQGFGRLIRSRDDRGTVVILDPRVRRKPYGRQFLAALPPCRIVEPDAKSTNVPASTPSPTQPSPPSIA